ncbi:MAG: ABC transporter ATP-binding protein [Thaumarchaeota archaeon]|nr:ABC transporter ATP-binding protein [Nitrososphaerota archaeon]MCL5317392.1 ABC transporter ATP-binding protein [Nitrososphaerota archaeon]
MASRVSVELRDVWKIYGDTGVTTTALKGVNFKVKRGEFTSIVGPSGSGKSTLLNILGTLDVPTKGKVFIDGVDTSTLNDSQLSRLRSEKIGFIFQSFNLIPRMTALMNVELPLINQGVDGDKRKDRALDKLEKVGLLKKALNTPFQLSGGEQQRVAVARALVTDPALILADEPTGNLDTKNTEVIVNLLKELNRSTGTTFLVITHNPEVSNRTQRIIYLKDGTVEREETPAS